MDERIKDLIIKILLKNNIATFIETGTMYGHTAKWASDYFNIVYTIEKDTQLFNSTKEKFNNSNIICINGESSDCLSSILKEIEGYVIFWLDAHWSGGKTSGEAKECPILEEIKVINEWNLECIILIDDARLFLSPPYEPHKPDHWPTISDIISKVEKKYIVIIYDVIIVVPFHLKPIVEQFCIYENTLAWKKRNANISMNHKQESHLKKSLYHLKRFIAKTKIR